MVAQVYMRVIPVGAHWISQGLHIIYVCAVGFY